MIGADTATDQGMPRECVTNKLGSVSLDVKHMSRIGLPLVLRKFSGANDDQDHIFLPEKLNANIDTGTSIVRPNGLAGFVNVRTLVASDHYRSVSWELGLRKAL